MPKPIGLKIDVEASIAELAKQPDITLGGTVRVGKMIVSASGVTTDGQTKSLSPDELSLTEAGQLGRGSSGSVRRVRRAKTNEYLALKEIKVTSTAHLTEIQRELETLHSSTSKPSPYLVDFYGAYSQEGSVYIAMECMHGSLADMSTIPMDVLSRITSDILKGLHYLHRTRHLVHRDLKPSNILYNSRGCVKISDFGVSSQLECTKANTTSFIGTVTYMSPERLKGDPYNYAADVWSLGITLAELAFGSHPYHSLITQNQGTEGRFWALMSHLSTASPAIEMPGTMDASFNDFVCRCLHKEADKRATVDELLAHPFITQNSHHTEQEDHLHVWQWLAKVDARVAAPVVAEGHQQQQQQAAAQNGANGAGGGQFLEDALSNLVDIGN